ncbi:MAG TPA: hypothetical protein VGT98_16335 [Candidatus Elarobacter sp.]|nr:hypothetical protein [Candidatus Elarobacter sp.]
MRPGLVPFALLTASLACASSQPLPENRESSTMMVRGGGGGGAALVRYFTDVSSTTDTIPQSAVQLWTRLPGAYAAMGIPVSLVDTASHVLGAVRVPMRNRLGKSPLSAFIECGLTPLGTQRANGYLVALSALTEVRDLGGGSAAVRTVVSATARDDAGSSNPLQCGSTGRIERDIATTLRSAK